MSELDTGHPPRGWYPDPAGSSGWRYFNGETWTEAVEADVSNVQAKALEATTTKVVGHLRGWLLDIAVVAAAVRLLGSLAGRDHTMQLIRFLHELWAFFQYEAKHPNTTRLAPTLPAGANGWTTLLAALAGSVTVAATVVLLVWQLRAARTAKALGYPARFSPGAGIWMWFIPVANLVLPYQALADLLPPDHRDRRLAWAAMASRLFNMIGLLCIVTAVVDSSVAALTTGLCVEATASMAWLILMRAIVGAVAINHREFLASSSKN